MTSAEWVTVVANVIMAIASLATVAVAALALKAVTKELRFQIRAPRATHLLERLEVLRAELVSARSRLVGDHESLAAATNFGVALHEDGEFHLSHKARLATYLTRRNHLIPAVKDFEAAMIAATVVFGDDIAEPCREVLDEVRGHLLKWDELLTLMDQPEPDRPPQYSTQLRGLFNAVLDNGEKDEFWRAFDKRAASLQSILKPHLHL